ncbi:MAG: STT3 domain-containing protein [Ignisphaera sp.]
MSTKIYAMLHKFWSKYSLLILTILVFLAALTAFWLRAQQYFNIVKGIGALYPEAKLDELDTFVNYWIVYYMDKNGPLSFYDLTKDNPATCLFWYPECRDIAHSELPGHIYTIYILYQIVKPLGISLYDLMALIPPLLGALGVIFVALVVKEVSGNNLASILSAFAYAFMFMSREAAGFTVKYSFGLFTAPLSLWLHIRLVKKPSILNAVLAGLGLAYAATVWTGVGLSYIPVYLTLALAPLFLDLSTKENLRKYTLAYAIEILIPIMTMFLIQPYRGGRAVIWLMFLVAFTLYAIGAGLKFLLGSKRGYKLYIVILVVSICLGLSIVGLMATSREFLEAVTKVIPMAGKILLGLGINPGGVAETVAQYQAGHELAGEPYMLILLLSIVFLGIPIAIADIIRRKDVLLLSLMIWGFMAWYATYNTSYFSDYTKIAFAIVTGIIAGRFLTLSTPTIRSVGRYIKVNFSFEKFLALLLAIAVALPTIYAAYGMSTTYSALSTMITRAEGFFVQTDVWLRALDFIRRNTSENALVISWWDYGYWLSVIGNRSTVADGATISGSKIQRLAQFFVSEYNISYEILKEFGVCRKDDAYIVIFSPVDVYVNTQELTLYISFPVYPLGFGDIPKFISAMVYLATGTWGSSGLQYTTSKLGYDIYANEWIIQGVTTMGNIRVAAFVSLNFNSTKVISATLPRLFIWAVTEKLKELYPGFKQTIIPALIGVKQNNVVIYVSSATGEAITFDYSLNPTLLNQSIYEIAYVAVSQPYQLYQLMQTFSVSRYVFVAILKLREDVLKTICS